MDAFERFGRWYEEVWKASGKSQTDLATELKCSASYVSRIVGRHRAPRLSEAAAIERLTKGWEGKQIAASEWDGLATVPEDSRRKTGTEG